MQMAVVICIAVYYKHIYFKIESIWIFDFDI